MKRLTNNPWIVCMSAAGIGFYQFIQIVSFNTLNKYLTEAFNMTSSEVSFLSSLFFYGNMILVIPAGIIVDRISIRKIILVTMIITLISEIIFMSTNSLIFIAIARFIAGISIGPFGFITSMRLVMQWFSIERFSLLIGIIISYAMLGGVLAQTPLMFIAENVGWRNAMQVNLLLGIILLIFIFLFVYDYPTNKIYQHTLYSTSIKISLKKASLNIQNWYCGIFASLLNLPIFLLGSLWGNIYLIKVYAITEIYASFITSMLFVGFLFGSPFFSYFSNVIQMRKLPMLIGIILTSSIMIIIIENTSFCIMTLTILFLLIGFGSSAQVLVYPMLAENNCLSIMSVAQGIVSTIIMMGGAIFQPLLGWLIARNLKDSEISIYYATKSDFRFGLWLLPISLLISSIFVLLMRETYCKTTNKKVLSI